MKKLYIFHFINFVLKSYINIYQKNAREPYMTARHLKDTDQLETMGLDIGQVIDFQQKYVSFMHVFYM